MVRGTNKHRWPTSVHSQVEAVFHCIRSFRQSKANCHDGIRSVGAWRVYRYEAHRFVDFFTKHGGTNLLVAHDLVSALDLYLNDVLERLAHNHRSRQTFETLLAGLSKLEFAINSYNRSHSLDLPELDTAAVRTRYIDKARKILPTSSRTTFRAYPDPLGLIEAIEGECFQLMACLQFEGGLRCEGVGSAGNNLKNPLTTQALNGTGPDPVTGTTVGIITVREKGGKQTRHYISATTYDRLVSFIARHDKLEADYRDYLSALNTAARATGQYQSGRGTHGLKHNFANERYHECVNNGYTHEGALQQTSLELAHYRYRETLTYTKG
jgi:hypothetical protein